MKIHSFQARPAVSRQILKDAAPKPSDNPRDQFTPQSADKPEKKFSIGKAVLHSASCGATALMSGFATAAFGAPGFLGSVALASVAHGITAHARGYDWKEASLNGAGIAAVGSFMGMSQQPALVYFGAGVAATGGLLAAQN